MARKGKDAAEIAVDVSTEISSQGLTELKEFNSVIQELAGSGAVGSEFIGLLKITLDELRNTKGSDEIKVIVKELKEAGKELKNIQRVSDNLRSKKSKIKNVSDSLVTNIASYKSENSIRLSNIEKQALKKFNDTSDKLNDAAKKQEEVVDNFLKLFDKWKGINPEKAAEYAKMAQNADRDFQRKQRASRGEKSEWQKEIERRNRDSAERRKALEAMGKVDEYLNMEAESKLAGFYSRAKNGARSKKQFYNNSGLRRELWRLEDNYERRGGIIGLSARFGGWVSNKLGIGNDAFNNGIQGAGINLGTVGMGSFVAGLKVAAGALQKFSKTVLSSYSEIDKIKANLSVVYGGRGTSDSVFEEIAQYAIKSPFSVAQTAQQAVLLKQTGMEESEVMKNLKVFGDLAGGNQEKLNRLIENFSKINANEYVTARNMQQFAMAGIPIYKAIADQLGIRTSEVRDRVSKREVSADDVMKALTALTEKGGMFYNAVEIGSRTYAARQTNLADTMQLGNAAAGELAYRWFGESLLEIKEWAAGVYRDKTEEWVHENRINDSLALELALNEIDDRIKDAEKRGLSQDYIKELKVQKMEVQNASTVGNGINEAEFARKFEEYNKNAFGVKFNPEEMNKLIKDYVENAIMSTTYGYNSFKPGALADVVNNPSFKSAGRFAIASETTFSSGVGHKYQNIEEDIAKVKFGLDALSAEAKLAAYGLTHKDMWFAQNSWSVANDAIGITKNQTRSADDLSRRYSYLIRKEYNDRLKEAMKDYVANTSFETNTGDGWVRNYSPYEKYGYRERGYKASKGSGTSLRNIAKEKDSTSSLVERFEKFYKTTESARLEQEAADKEMVRILKEIYDERQTFGMSPENMFAFMDYRKDANGNIVRNDGGELRAEEIVSVLKRQFDLENSQDLLFNEESFEESFEVLSKNIKGLGRSIDTVFVNATGNATTGKTAKNLVDRMLNTTDVTAMNEYISSLKALADSSGNKDLSTYVSAMLSDLSLPEDLNLAFIEDEKRIKKNFDTSLSPLIRELTEKYLGVSLFRTLGSSLGSVNPNDQFGIKTTLSYMRNGSDRSMINAIATGLMNQTGSDRKTWKEISQYMSRKSEKFYIDKNQGYVDKNGEVQAGRSTGRYIKGFYDITASRYDMERAALMAGRGNTIQAISGEYSKLEDNLEKFFAELISSKETKDATAKYIEAKAIEEAKLSRYTGLKENGKLTDAQEKEMTKIQETIKYLEETSALATLGIEQNEEYRNAVTAITLDIIKLSDGTKKYASAYTEALNVYYEEIHERNLLTTSLASFRQSIDELDSHIKKMVGDAAANNYTLLDNEALNDVKGIDNKKRILENIVKATVGDENMSEIIKEVFGEKSTQEILSDILTRSSSVDESTPEMADVIQNKGKANFYDSDLYKEFVKNFGTLDSLLSQITGENVVSNDKNLNDLATKIVTKYELNPDAFDSYIKKDFRVYSEEYLNKHNNTSAEKWYNDFGSVEEAKAALEELYNTAIKVLATEKGYSLINVTTDMIIGAFAKEAKDLISKGSGLYDANNKFAFEQARTAKLGSGVSDGVSLYGGLTRMYAGNNAREQTAISYLGLPENTSWKDLITNKYFDENNNVKQDEIDNLIKQRKSLGLNTKEPLIDAESIREAEAEMWNLKKLSEDISKSLDNLARSMESAFDSAIVDAISNSMVTLGESMRDSVDATDGINKGLRDTFTNLLKNIGPQMTSTGLAIAAGGATAKNGKPDWGIIMGGLGLAAAGGFLSWSGGLLSDPGKDDDEDAQKEARLKSLADLLSDLIGQAKTDAEYYERSLRHEMALSTDYGVSSRSVNDMILTPNGNFSTHPDDYLIATKNPYALGGGGTKVNISIVNESGETVKIASTKERKNENGDVDIEAVIVAVTANAIANGDMDGAFAQRDARSRGVSRTY